MPMPSATTCQAEGTAKIRLAHLPSPSLVATNLGNLLRREFDGRR
jgi:hypothetical protein